MSFTFDDAVRVPSRVLMREIGGEGVLLQLDTSTYFGLDAVGTRMWNQLVASPTIGHACERLLAEFEVEPQMLRNDIEQLTAKLLAFDWQTAVRDQRLEAGRLYSVGVHPQRAFVK